MTPGEVVAYGLGPFRVTLFDVADELLVLLVLLLGGELVPVLVGGPVMPRMLLALYARAC